MLERSWTSTADTIVGRKEPLGLIPLLAIPLWSASIAIAAGLGYGTYQSVFGTNQASFDGGWNDGPTFDRRMAVMKELWLKFDRDIQFKCPSFVTKDGGKWWRQFKLELNEFGVFYGSVGSHPGFMTGWSSKTVPAPEVGGAIARLESLTGWGQFVEKTCPGTFPGLGIGLTPSEAEKAAAEAAAKNASGRQDPFSLFGASFGTALGIGVIGLLGFMWISGAASRGGFRGGELRGVELRAARRKASRRRRLR